MFEDTCRICRKTEDILIDVFSDGIYEIDLDERIFLIYGLKILPDDEITKNICRSCYYFTNSVYEQRLTALKNDRIFKEECDRIKNKKNEHKSPEITFQNQEVSEHLQEVLSNSLLKPPEIVYDREKDHFFKSLSLRTVPDVSCHSSIVRLMHKYPSLNIPKECHTWNFDLVLKTDRMQSKNQAKKSLGKWIFYRKQTKTGCNYSFKKKVDTITTLKKRYNTRRQSGSRSLTVSDNELSQLYDYSDQEFESVKKKKLNNEKCMEVQENTKEATNDLDLSSDTSLIRVDNERKLYLCQTCGKVFDCVKDLKVHQNTSHNKSLRCAKCSKSFSVVEELVMHNILNHLTKTIEEEQEESNKLSKEPEKNDTVAVSSEKCKKPVTNYKDEKYAYVIEEPDMMELVISDDEEVINPAPPATKRVVARKSTTQIKNPYFSMRKNYPRKNCNLNDPIDLTGTLVSVEEEGQPVDKKTTENILQPDENILQPDENILQPDENILQPDENILQPDEKIESPKNGLVETVDPEKFIWVDLSNESIEIDLSPKKPSEASDETVTNESPRQTIPKQAGKTFIKTSVIRSTPTNLIKTSGETSDVTSSKEAVPHEENQALINLINVLKNFNTTKTEPNKLPSWNNTTINLSENNDEVTMLAEADDASKSTIDTSNKDEKQEEELEEIFIGNLCRRHSKKIHESYTPTFLLKDFQKIVERNYVFVEFLIKPNSKFSFLFAKFIDNQKPKLPVQTWSDSNVNDVPYQMYKKYVKEIKTKNETSATIKPRVSSLIPAVPLTRKDKLSANEYTNPRITAPIIHTYSKLHSKSKYLIKNKKNTKEESKKNHLEKSNNLKLQPDQMENLKKSLAPITTTPIQVLTTNTQSVVNVMPHTTAVQPILSPYIQYPNQMPISIPSSMNLQQNFIQNSSMSAMHCISAPAINRPIIVNSINTMQDFCQPLFAQQFNQQTNIQNFMAINPQPVLNQPHMQPVPTPQLCAPGASTSKPSIRIKDISELRDSNQQQNVNPHQFFV